MNRTSHENGKLNDSVSFNVMDSNWCKSKNFLMKDDVFLKKPL